MTVTEMRAHNKRAAKIRKTLRNIANTIAVFSILATMLVGMYGVNTDPEAFWFLLPIVIIGASCAIYGNEKHTHTYWHKQGVFG